MNGKEFTKDELLKMVTWNNAAYYFAVLFFSEEF